MKQDGPLFTEAGDRSKCLKKKKSQGYSEKPCVKKKTKTTKNLK